MNLQTTNRWVMLAANIGVLTGIVVLVIEINQNTQAMSTASRDESVSHALNFFEQSMDTQIISVATYKRKTGKELTDFERHQLLRHQYYNFRVFENMYIQYQRGLYTLQKLFDFSVCSSGSFHTIILPGDVIMVNRFCL